MGISLQQDRRIAGADKSTEGGSMKLNWQRISENVLIICLCCVPVYILIGIIFFVSTVTIHPDERIPKIEEQVNIVTQQFQEILGDLSKK